MNDSNPGGKPDDLTAKAEKLAADALEAGKKFIATDTGKKVADATESASPTAEEMRKKVVDSELGKKALESDLGKQAMEFAEQANEKTKAQYPQCAGAQCRDWRGGGCGGCAAAAVHRPDDRRAHRRRARLSAHGYQEKLMRCPFCGNDDSQVKDSRPTEDASAIRRRRQCPACGGRFTTFERIQLRELTIVKKSGKREVFDRDKLARRIEIACRKRPVAPERIERMVNGVVRQLESTRRKRNRGRSRSAKW